MSIIPFGQGHSRVVTSIPIHQEECDNFDELGRSEEERRFIDQFERIFRAASLGNLEACRKIVDEEGYTDFDAFSIGRFATSTGKSYDLFTPKKIAEFFGHHRIVDFFKSAHEIVKLH